MKQKIKQDLKSDTDKSVTWKLRKGKVIVVENARTASLVIIAQELKDLREKITVLKEVISRLETEAA